MSHHLFHTTSAPRLCKPRKKSIPMRTPRYAVTRCSVERWSPAAPITLPMLVSTAARPTTECNAATICGSSVAVMRRPMIAPTVPPIAATPANCASTSRGKPTAAREARMPEPTPRIPSALPWRAVACEAKPESEAVTPCSKILIQ